MFRLLWLFTNPYPFAGPVVVTVLGYRTSCQTYQTGLSYWATAVLFRKTADFVVVAAAYTVRIVQVVDVADH
ncbi:MAG: hypothetical protein Q8O99_07660 [bacterium]|nr:hypothetical protein [bacterium]